MPATTAYDVRLARILKQVGAALTVAIFMLAVWFLHRELASVSWSAVAANVHSHSSWRIFLACCCAAGGYAVLTAYDALAMRYIRRPIPYRKTALTAFIAFAMAHNVGVSAISGGSVRYRMYSAMGLSASEIAKVIAFCSGTFAVGGTFLISAALLFLPRSDLGSLGLSVPAAYPLGIAGMALVGAYVISPLLRTSPIRLGNWQTDYPTLSITVRQLVISLADLLLAAGTLYVLLAPALDIPFPAFVGVYVAAIAAGLVSSLPGGIGVFEAVLLLAFPTVDRALLVSTIVVYRLIYYLAPLALALALLVGNEIRAGKAHLSRAGQRAAEGLSWISPQAFGTLAFLAGVVLLLSGATPAVDSRLAIIDRYVPDVLLEASHLAGSVLGLCLLIVARGLYRRLRSALQLTLGLLLAGAAASLLKGLDYEEACVLTGLAILLWLSRATFHRRGSFGRQSLSGGWLIAIVTVLIGTAWVGFFSYRDVAYSNELIWQFSLNGDAPRTLRAMMLVAAGAMGFALWQLIRPRPPIAPPMGPADVDDVRRIIAYATDPSANAALIGDKRLLFNDDRTAFIMYQIHDRSWIALGEPVGPLETHEALAWRFLEQCDRHDGRPAFYQVSHENLSLYVDMGLTLWKLGEEGRLYLPEFSLHGPERADFRQARNRAMRLGATFDVIAREQLPAIMPELRAISDAWLAKKHVAEKGFSLGRFSETYLSYFDCAVIRLGESIVAFANLWPSEAGRALSIDLMRYDDRAPKGSMDYLFVELIGWARQHGYEWFSLGMAPLSGLEQHPLAPMWQKFGNAIFRYADEYYSFEGLRAYKEKFGPRWEARYLACPGGLAFPRVLLDATILVSGGLTAVVKK